MSKQKKQKHKKHATATGVISVTSRGVGYVPIENFAEDIEVPPEHLNTALNGDIVEITIDAPKKDRRRSGRVVRVNERAKTRFVGTLERENNVWHLVSDDRRMYVNIAVTSFTKNLAQEDMRPNTKAVVTLLPWHDPGKAPEGRLDEILGPAGAHDVEMRAIVIGHHFDTSFPPEVAKEARALLNRRPISPEEARERKDFRNVPTFTIDPKDAKDFDDALSFRTIDASTIEVGIHIADVSHYVRPGSMLDKEAQERGTSVYLVDRTIPMLPEELSNDLCSLNEGEDKRAFSAVFELTRDGKIKKRWFGKTIIHSQKRFTYEEAQKHIDARAGLFAEALEQLNTRAQHMRAERIAQGALEFEQDEFEFELDAKGRPVSIKRKERLAVHKLVEEYMLLANRAVAEYINAHAEKRGREPVFVYRIHDVPDSEKIEELAVFLRAVGYTLNTKKEITGKEINAMLSKIKGTPVEALITQATIRAMSKAIYTTNNIGHFGLALEHYTHFTSPIRRYPDILAHRLLEHCLNGSPVPERRLSEYEALAVRSSEREAAAAAAERDSVKYKQIEFMQDKVGQTFSGTITGVVAWGLYVAEDTTGAEGLIHISSLPGYITFDKKNFALVNTKTKKRYRLGDRVTVRLDSADLEHKTLTWNLVPPQAG